MQSTVIDRTLEVLNSDWYKKMFNCYSDIAIASHDFFVKEKKFSIATLPITTGSISSPMGLGSDSIPVKVDLLGSETYLADSMQFLLEYCLRFDNRGVYYIMPSFRGEDSDKRHLSQFHHSESEIVGSLADVMSLCEQYIKYLSQVLIQKDYLLESVSESKIKEIKRLINTEKIPEIKFKNAVSLLKENNKHNCIENTEGILTINDEGEKWLMEHFSGPVWLTHFEHRSVPFYQAYDEEDSKYSLSADLLIGIGETIGCGERADYQSVIQSLEDHQVDPSDYKWYIDMKRDFPMQTSGFGMGIERFIAWIFDEDDIRKIPYVYREKNINIFP